MNLLINERQCLREKSNKGRIFRRNIAITPSAFLLLNA